MYWMSFPTSTNVGLLHSDCLLSTAPSTSQQLVPCCSSMYVHYQMLASTSGRQQAELNQSQVRGLWPHLNIQKLPSWQQHRSGVVHFACARPSARSEQDGRGGRSPWQGVQQEPGWGWVPGGWGPPARAWFHKARGLLTHGSHHFWFLKESLLLHHPSGCWLLLTRNSGERLEVAVNKGFLNILFRRNKGKYNILSQYISFKIDINTNYLLKGKCWIVVWS